MTVLVTEGDRLVTLGGRPSWLKRPSVPLAQYGSGSVPLIGEGRTISFARLYREQLWVAVAVNKLTRQVARLPLKLYTKDSQGLKQRVGGHALNDALRSPRPRSGPAQLKQWLTQPTLVHGNSVVRKLRPRPGAPPTGFEPLDWRYLIAHGEEGGPVEMWETSQPGKPRFLDPDDVIHTAWESGDGPFGVSPLQQLGVTIAIEDAAQRYAQANLRNAARPSGAVVIPAEVKTTREERDEYKAEIRELYAGPDKAFQVPVLGGGMKWEEFGGSAKEAELIDTRRLGREEMAAVYDIPPPLIGILDKATYSNIDTQHGMLYTDTLGPWLSLEQDVLQAQLIDSEPVWAQAGLFVEYDLSEVLKGALRERADALRTQIESGVLTVNEARQIENRPRYEHDNADTPHLPRNNLRRIDEPPAAVVAPAPASQ